MIDRKRVISVTTDYTLAKAIDRMDLYGYRTLPVVNYGRYAGVIDKYSIYEHIYIMRDIDLHSAEVSDVMRTDIQCVYASDIIEKAAVAFYDQRYQFVPVMMDDTVDQFLGIISTNAIMDLFASAMGLARPAHRLTLEIDDYRGELAKLTRAVMHSGGNITSLITVQHHEALAPNGDPKVEIVVKFEGDLDATAAACKAMGAKITHIDRFEGEFRERRGKFLPDFLLPR